MKLGTIARIAVENGLGYSKVASLKTFEDIPEKILILTPNKTKQTKLYNRSL